MFGMEQLAEEISNGKMFLKEVGLTLCSGGITGDMLTTSGVAVHTDKEILREIGFTFAE